MLCAGAAQTRGLHGVGEPSEHGGGGAGKSVSRGGGFTGSQVFHVWRHTFNKVEMMPRD